MKQLIFTIVALLLSFNTIYAATYTPVPGQVKLPVKYMCKYAIEGDNSYVFNPYEYLISLKDIVKDKVKIYENTRCISVDK